MSDETVGYVRDWMSARPITVSPECPLEEVLRIMRSRGIRHLLVADAEQLVGVVSSRDVRRPLTDRGTPITSATPVGQVMTESPVTVGPDLPLTEAARLMLDSKIGSLPVIEGDQVVGILTKSDALEALVVWAEGKPRP
jgi:CBS domain-containing protein